MTAIGEVDYAALKQKIREQIELIEKAPPQSEQFDEVRNDLTPLIKSWGAEIQILITDLSIWCESDACIYAFEDILELYGDELEDEQFAICADKAQM